MGTAIINLISIEPGEKINATVPIRALDQQGFLVMATAKGEIKRSKLSEFQNLRANGLKSFDVEDDDQLCWVHLTTGNEDIVIASEQGQAVGSPSRKLRPSGRSFRRRARHEPGAGDRVVGMEVAARSWIYWSCAEWVRKADGALGVSASTSRRQRRPDHAGHGQDRSDRRPEGGRTG